jgi:magnesium-transporting ATPase (P-type)
MFDDNRPDTIALSILVTIEMFNTFNALSENQSLLVNPPWANIWVVLAVALSIGLHCVILYFEFFRDIFSTADLNSTEWAAVLLISFPVILLDEILKLISRHLSASSRGKAKTKRD